jgi:prevent-host-death family protein
LPTVTAREARACFSDLINRAAYAKERVTITRKGRKMAAIIPMELYSLLESVLEEFEYNKDVEEARAALAEVERKGSVPWEQVKSELGL